MHTVFYYDGKVTDFFEIEKDTVLSMLIPLDTSGEYTQTVYVSDIYEDVVLDEIDISGGKVVAGVNSYKAVSTCLAELKSGQKYRFFFDEMGRIAAAQSVDSIKYYGFFNAVKKSVFDGVTVSLFATDGTWLEAKLANNISCNGSKIAAADIYSNGELFPSGQLKPQLVEYKINADGKIISIATPTDVTSIRFTNEEYDIIERDEFRLSFMSGSARFFNSTGTITFGEKAHLAADATIMIIPTDTSAKNEFLIATPDKLTHNISYTGIKLYNCDEYACSGLAIVADNTASYRGTTPMVVSNVKTVLNEDGDTVERVYGYSRTTYETENDVAEYTSLGAITGAEAQLKAGDVIIPVINADGKLVNFERTHNAGVSTYGASSTTIYSDYVTVYGKVIDSSADYVVLDYSADKASFRLYSTSVYVCEPSRDGGYTVRLGSVSDLNVGDDVVIRSYYLRGTVAVVYKK